MVLANHYKIGLACIGGYYMHDVVCALKGAGDFTVEIVGWDSEGGSAIPYYGEAIYDVDCLAMDGKIVNVVPRLRQWKNILSPINEGCQIDLEPSIINYAQAICQNLNIHGTCDMDIALNEEGVPRILDMSSRLSGSIGASLAAGANFPAQLIRMLFGLPLKEYSVRNGVCLRPVNHSGFYGFY